MSVDGWTLERRQGSAAAFHEREVPEPAAPAVWWFEVSSPAIVLGSTQPWDVVDGDAAAAAGVEVVRRRSGGGAVLLSPGSVTWVDVILPAGHRRWEDDVGRSFRWLGEAWVQALGHLGVAGARAHEGPLVRTAWSDLVCFAGLGPGEVTVSGAKLVGISQRRTRRAARFQCGLLHRWDPGELLGLLRLDAGHPGEGAGVLGSAAVGLGELVPGRVPGTEVVGALLDALGPADA